jgi:hypothetical protein
MDVDYSRFLVKCVINNDVIIRDVSLRFVLERTRGTGLYIFYFKMADDNSVLVFIFGCYYSSLFLTSSRNKCLSYLKTQWKPWTWNIFFYLESRRKKWEKKGAGKLVKQIIEDKNIRWTYTDRIFPMHWQRYEHYTWIMPGIRWTARFVILL